MAIPPALAPQGMITDLSDLESQLGQYDPGMIFVGPLLRLSMESSYRYFFIAGNGSKVYEAIGLGMIKAAKYAQQQRADIVEKLESHFTGVMTFGRHLEMAHAVSTRWPNVETAGVLASAALAIPSELTKVADRHESVDDCSYPGTRSVDYGEHPVEARERVDYVKVIDSVSTSAPPWTRDQMQPMPVLHPASTPAPASLPIATPIRLLGGDRAGTQQQHSSQDDMVLLLSELKSVWHPAPTPAPLSLPIVGAVPSRPQRVLEA